MAREMRRWDLEVGVEMWKVTLSKSETTWSMAVGVVLEGWSVQLGLEGCGKVCETYSGANRSLSMLSISTF